MRRDRTTSTRQNHDPIHDVSQSNQTMNDHPPFQQIFQTLKDLEASAARIRTLSQRASRLLTQARKETARLEKLTAQMEKACQKRRKTEL